MTSVRYPYQGANTHAIRATADDSRRAGVEMRRFISSFEATCGRLPSVLAGEQLLAAANTSVATVSAHASQLPAVYELQAKAAHLWADAVDVFDAQVEELNQTWAQAHPGFWGRVANPLGWMLDSLDEKERDKRIGQLKLQLDMAYRRLEAGLDAMADQIAATLSAGPGPATDGFYRSATEHVAAVKARCDNAAHPSLWERIADQVGSTMVEDITAATDLFGSVHDWVDEAGIWSYNHVVVPGVNSLANVGQAVAEHPEDLAWMLDGLALTGAGAAGELLGGGLDLTGVGAAVGVPVNVASTGAIVAGAGMTVYGATDLAAHASGNHNTLLNKVHGSSGSARGAPGDPLPESDRPPTAGKNWEGRVAKSGKGYVWQDPENAKIVRGEGKEANQVRIMDPTARYPHGYVRFYDKAGHPIDLNGNPTEKANTHIPMNPDGSYPIPKGWKP